MVGGFDGQNFVATVEVYDPATDTWTQGVPLPSGRSGHAAAVSYKHQCLLHCDQHNVLCSKKSDNEDSKAHGSGCGKSSPLKRTL